MTSFDRANRKAARMPCMLWDVFISHANEDKEEIARPLAALLTAKGIRVWLDEEQIVLGDSLSRNIGEGLAKSRFGVLTVTSSCFDKYYVQREKQALLARQTASGRFILPILHKIERHTLLSREPFSPISSALRPAKACRRWLTLSTAQWRTCRVSSLPPA